MKCGGKMKSRRIVMNALFVGLAIVLSRFLSVRIPIGGAEGIRFGIGTLPVILAGISLGPLDGAVVGAVSDLLGYFIYPMGAFMPQFTLTSLLYGLIPGLLFRYILRKRLTFANLFITSMIAEVIGISITPLLINQLFQIPWAVLMPPRLITFVLRIIINPMIIFELLKRVPQLRTGMIFPMEKKS